MTWAISLVQGYQSKNHRWAALYRVFEGFVQAKIAYNGSVLGSSQFTLLPQLPLKMTLDFKVIKIDTNIIISLH